MRHEVELLHTEGHHTRLTSWTVSNSSSVLLVVGGSLAGVKHGAYELLERYGLAFRIEGMSVYMHHACQSWELTMGNIWTLLWCSALSLTIWHVRNLLDHR